jgi:hypothetical protein
LVVNTEQTCIHLVPIWGSKIWELKKTKYIKVYGTEDKRQVTILYFLQETNIAYISKSFSKVPPQQLTWA